MKSVNELIWLLPILFMIHDFEEIILLEWWLQKSREDVIRKFPRIGKRFIDNIDNTKTSTLSVGVAEEFIFCSIIALYSDISHNYELWFGAMVAFAFHLVIHILESIVYRGYTLGTVTSCIVLPASLYVIKKVYCNADIVNIFFWCIFAVFIMVVNLFLIHKFYKWKAN